MHSGGRGGGWHQPEKQTPLHIFEVVTARPSLLWRFSLEGSDVEALDCIHLKPLTVRNERRNQEEAVELSALRLKWAKWYLEKQSPSGLFIMPTVRVAQILTLLLLLMWLGYETRRSKDSILSQERALESHMTWIETERHSQNHAVGSASAEWNELMIVWGCLLPPVVCESPGCLSTFPACPAVKTFFTYSWPLH